MDLLFQFAGRGLECMHNVFVIDSQQRCEDDDDNCNDVPPYGTHNAVLSAMLVLRGESIRTYPFLPNPPPPILHLFPIKKPISL